MSTISISCKYFYCPPGNSLSVDQLNISLMSVPPGATVVLCGDFNAPGIDWTTVTPVVGSSASNNLCAVVQNNFSLLLVLPVHTTFWIWFLLHQLILYLLPTLWTIYLTLTMML